MTEPSFLVKVPLTGLWNDTPNFLIESVVPTGLPFAHLGPSDKSLG